MTEFHPWESQPAELGLCIFHGFLYHKSVRCRPRVLGFECRKMKHVDGIISWCPFHWVLGAGPSFMQRFQFQFFP